MQPDFLGFDVPPTLSFNAPPLDVQVQWAATLQSATPEQLRELALSLMQQNYTLQDLMQQTATALWRRTQPVECSGLPGLGPK